MIGGLAWRNLHRRPVRTALCVFGLAVTAAVMLVWGAITGGFSQKLHEAATGLELGDLQLHAPGFSDGQDIYNALSDPEPVIARLEGQGLHASPRLFGFALAASGEQAAGVRVHGLDPAREARVTRLHAHVGQGQWLDALEPRGVVVGRMLARQLGLAPGNELILLGQALDGSLASEVYEVRGVLQSVSSDVDNRGVFVVGPAFRDFFLMAKGAHELALARTDFEEDVETVASRLTALDLAGGELRTWRQLRPLLARMLDLLSVTAYFTLIFTYLAVGGFVLNMTFMIVHDRMREYGVMKACGMEPRQVASMIVTELFFLAVMAGLGAWAIGLPVAHHFATTGLDFSFAIDRLAFAGMNLEPVLFATVGPRQALAPVVFLLVMMPLFGLYPAIEAALVTPVRALQHR